MNERQLKKIYPQGKITNEKIVDDNWLTLPLTRGCYYQIEKKTLSASEIKLLQTLFSVSSNDATSHKWYQILFGEQSAPSGIFRLFQLKLQPTKDFERNEWEQTVKTTFPAAVALFSTACDQYILVETQGTENYSKQVIEGIFLSLDNDFSTTTKVYLGNYSDKTRLKAVFEIERQLFQWCLAKNSQQRLYTLADEALLYYTRQLFQTSPLTACLKESMSFDDEMKNIILMLWETQGNVSLSAKKLFLHRNTLQYRLDKFYDTYDLNLKKVSDLLLVYLFLINE